MAVRRKAITATTRRPNLNPVAGMKKISFALRQVLGGCDAVALRNGNLGRRSRFAVKQAGGPGSSVVHQKGRLPLAAQHALSVADAEAAAMPAGSGRAFA